MVLSKQELIAALQNEARILNHLVSKVEPHMVDYRPTPKQRSTIELLRYLSHMGPLLLPAMKTGQFDGAAWQAASAAAAAKNLQQISASLATLGEQYAQLAGGFSDEDFRGEIEMFGSRASRGSAYRLSGVGRTRRLPHATVPVPEGQRPRRTEHLQSVGRSGRDDAGGVVTAFPLLDRLFVHMIDHDHRDRPLGLDQLQAQFLLNRVVGGKTLRDIG